MVPPLANYYDINSLPGIPGQDGGTGQLTPSEKVFSNHAIVKYWWDDGSHSYFDLSYWTTYADPNDMETKAIWGFGQSIDFFTMRTRTIPANAAWDLDFDPDQP